MRGRTAFDPAPRMGALARGSGSSERGPDALARRQDSGCHQGTGSGPHFGTREAAFSERGPGEFQWAASIDIRRRTANSPSSRVHQREGLRAGPHPFRAAIAPRLVPGVPSGPATLLTKEHFLDVMPRYFCQFTLNCYQWHQLLRHPWLPCDGRLSFSENRLARNSWQINWQWIRHLQFPTYDRPDSRNGGSPRPWESRVGSAQALGG